MTRVYKCLKFTIFTTLSISILKFSYAKNYLPSYVNIGNETNSTIILSTQVDVCTKLPESIVILPHDTQKIQVIHYDSMAGDCYTGHDWWFIADMTTSNSSKTEEEIGSFRWNDVGTHLFVESAWFNLLKPSHGYKIIDTHSDNELIITEN